MDKNAEKERLLKEIKYYTNRIENFHKETISRLYFESSDSEDDFPTFHAPGPSISELKTTESGLQTSLQALQELTNLTVLQYETNVMVEPPKIKRGRPITEPGIWREVTAECRIDAIPFSITFCTHQGYKKCAPILYRNLSVLPVKKAHEVELAQSVLPDLTRPSDVIEVVNSFATAFRSRRTSLARLANKYTNIQVEPAAEGGYLLKCGSVLAITWRLDNTWTPLTPFHHRMKFDLDYMEEEQLKIIKQAHKKISDPTITTDERTLLLAKIISTCLEQKATQDESMESETESTKRAERTVIEDEPDDNLIIIHENHEERTNIEGDRDVNVEREKEKEIMAPPKSLPKKAKPKGKENKVDNSKSLKRTADEAAAVGKKAKVDGNNVANENTAQATNEIEVAKDRNSKKNNENNKQTQVKVAKKSQTGATKQLSDSNKQKNKQSIAKESTTNTDKSKLIASKNVAKSSVKTKNQVITTDSEKPTKSTTDVEKTTKTTNGTAKTTKPTMITEKTAKTNQNAVKSSKNIPDSRNTKDTGPITLKSTENIQKNVNKQINIGKNIQNSKNSEQNKVVDVPKNNQKVQKSVTNYLKKQTLTKDSNVAITKNADKTKLMIKSHSTPSKTKKPENIGKNNLKGVVKHGNNSKIPLKKFVATSTPANFMWVSPRNRPSTSDTNSLNTNIPRLLNKPCPKTK